MAKYPNSTHTYSDTHFFKFFFLLFFIPVFFLLFLFEKFVEFELINSHKFYNVSIKSCNYVKNISTILLIIGSVLVTLKVFTAIEEWGEKVGCIIAIVGSASIPLRDFTKKKLLKMEKDFKVRKEIWDLILKQEEGESWFSAIEEDHMKAI